MKINIKFNNSKYEVNADDGVDISIPVEFNEDKNPKFYDTSNPKNKYYSNNKIEYNIKKTASCSVPIVEMNIHCMGTHTETANHIINDAPNISTIKSLNFVPSQLITVIPVTETDESYHHDIEQGDKVITKQILKNHNIDENFSKALIIRTSPNEGSKKHRNYNENHHPYLSNDAISYIKDLGVKHLLIDTPSVDRYNDNGKLGNHHIFFKNKNGECNSHTMTELIFVPDECKDGKYFLCIGFPNFKLDAAPSRPIIYKINKLP